MTEKEFKMNLLILGLKLHKPVKNISRIGPIEDVAIHIRKNRGIDGKIRVYLIGGRWDGGYVFFDTHSYKEILDQIENKLKQLKQ